MGETLQLHVIGGPKAKAGTTKSCAPTPVDVCMLVKGSIGLCEILMSILQRVCQKVAANDSQDIKVDMLLAGASIGSFLSPRSASLIRKEPNVLAPPTLIFDSLSVREIHLHVVVMLMDHVGQDATSISSCKHKVEATPASATRARCPLGYSLGCLAQRPA